MIKNRINDHHDFWKIKYKLTTYFSRKIILQNANGSILVIDNFQSLFTISHVHS